MKRDKKNIAAPPRPADAFLAWFCKWKYLEEIQGDLLELFGRRAEKTGRFLNCFYYWVGVIKYFRPMFWKTDLFNFYNGGFFMFRSNLKFAIRNIRKNFFFSAINITGLAVGIACVLYIFLYVQDEMSYDTFHEKRDRIYRVNVEAHFAGNDFNAAEAGGIVAPTMLKDFPEVETFARVNNWGLNFVRYNDISFKENRVLGADSTFFKIFSFPLLKGSADKVLASPGSVVISADAAEKYFGTEDPIGKTLYFDERNEYTVSGVFENIPHNSHLRADFIISISFDRNIGADGWTNSNYYTYILLKENADINQLQGKMHLLMDNYGWPELEKAGMRVDDLLATGVFWNFKLQHISEFHFDTKHIQRIGSVTDLSYIYIFGAIALFILIIASINFINLSTARASNRAKEVGIKKVVGSFRKDLVVQFLTESVVLSLISMVLALVLVALLKPYFFELIGKEFEISIATNLMFGLMLMGVVIFTGLLAGSFPALVLSKFKPIAVLKGNMSNAMKKGWLRSTLVVFQFTASIILIIGTMVIFNQLEFMQKKNLGFDKEQILVIDDPYILDEENNRGRAEAYKNRLLENPNVVSATMSGYLPIDSYRNSNGYFRDADKNDPKVMPYQSWRIDYDYFTTLGIKFIKGRNFSKEYATDSMAIVINRACWEHCEWENPMEHTLARIGTNEEIENYRVVGVVENFHFGSLKNKIEPLIFRLGNNAGYLSLKINNNISGVVEQAESLWKEMAGSKPFGYRFMDESYDKIYTSEMNILKLLRVFAVLAILIGCLGLFGLSAFTAEKRTKEIGIRKVHGATITNLIYLLSKEFSVLVIVSVIISSPAAYLLMENWLESYAYRIDISIETFFIAGLLALIIALGTVSYHAVKASLLNPAKSLKYE